ncbi:hypothetical protein LOK49_LG12G01286 [Camellia lanceoleosa]|uniref:Uncharacterized protein n=1 Tax=Camellia lanceoleosa TaxID=1840588 RepID=A0ACC0FUX3_9ERIC|nr:hypothetical protein LOK49_LG12G01286 [Camellia lanceoleosa]
MVVVLEKIDEQKGFKLFGTTDSREPKNAVEILEQREQKVLFHQSTELRRASNLHKSLDWDTAFFTSAGLLDPEELFIINNGFEKVEAHLLPVSQEDLCTRRYADSESTLDSDDFSLDSNQSTEVDLFEEIRAPIEKSNIMSNICKSVCKSGVGEAHKRETHSLKKLDDISRNRVKSTPTSRRQRVYMQGSKRVKEVVHPQIVQAFSVTTSNDSSASCSPSGSASSLKSSSNSRRKADSRKSRLATSSSTSKTPLRCLLGDKIVLENPSLSTPSLSMSNHSSNDPAKSTRNFKPSGLRMPSPKIGFFDEDAEKNGEANSFPHKSPKILSRMNMASGGQRKNISSGADHVKMGNKVATLGSGKILYYPRNGLGNSCSTSSTTSLESSSWVYITTGSASSLKSSSNSRKAILGKVVFLPLVQPPRLLSVLTRRQNCVGKSGRDFCFIFEQSALPNIGGVTSEKRPDKLQTTRILLENGDTKLGSVQNGVMNPSLNAIRRYAAQNQELDKNFPKMSSTSATSRNLPGKTSKGQTNTSPQLCRENCSRSSKVIDGGHNSKKLGLHSSLKAERKRTEGILKNEMGEESKRPMTKEHERASRRPLENDPHSLHDNEKENIPSFGDHVNGLNRCLEVIDLNKGVVIELEGKRGCSHSHLGDNFVENDRAPIYSSSFSKEYLFPCQQVSPNMLSKTGPLSLSTIVEFMPSTRTPLADKNSAPM